MTNNNQNNSLADDEERSYERSLEENRQRIISGENRSAGADLDSRNELKEGEKEELIAPAKSITSGGDAVGNDNAAKKENAADGISSGNKPRIETTLPPKELLDGREAEFNKSGPKIETGKIENKGMEERIMSLQNKRNQKPIILGLVLGLFIIVVLAGLYFFGDRIFKKDNPQEIIKSSLETMNSVESYAFAGDFNLDFVGSQEDKEKFSLAMKFDGQADESDANNVKSAFNIKPEMSISQRGGSENISFDLSTKSFGKVGEETAYFKLNNFDLGTAGMMYGKAIMPYKNKWYSLDTKELQKKSGVSKKEDFNPEEIIKKIKELSKKYEMIKFEKDLGDTELNNVDVYHYQVGIDSKAALDFYIELLETLPDEFTTSNKSLPKDGFKNLKVELKENREEILTVMDEVLTNVKTEVWIGKKDKMIYKMAMRGKFNQELADRLEEKMKEIDKDKYSDSKKMHSNEKGGIVGSREGISDNDIGELSFSATITMSDFNQPVNISKPENAEDLMKVLEEAMAGFMGRIGTPPGVNPSIDTDKDGLTDVMEDFYKTDKNNPDTDGDGYLDGDEVKNGYDPLVPGSAKLDYKKMFEEKK